MDPDFSVLIVILCPKQFITSVIGSEMEIRKANTVVAVNHVYMNEPWGGRSWRGKNNFQAVFSPLYEAKISNRSLSVYNAEIFFEGSGNQSHQWFNWRNKIQKNFFGTPYSSCRLPATSLAAMPRWPSLAVNANASLIENWCNTDLQTTLRGCPIWKWEQHWRVLSLNWGSPTLPCLTLEISRSLISPFKQITLAAHPGL